jgi:hypothetical protein
VLEPLLWSSCLPQCLFEVPVWPVLIESCAPPSLPSRKREFILHNFSSIIRSIPALRGAPDSFVVEMSRVSSWRLFGPSDIISYQVCPLMGLPQRSNAGVTADMLLPFDCR